MQNDKIAYKQLTSVDIDEQERIWDSRGKGYYGEYKVFRELYNRLTGNCKILMNLNIPVKNDVTTEIDLLLIHETGLYVFEVKHYKGTIYGQDSDNSWTQYFRNSRNNIFINPIAQNGYHMRAIKELFPQLPIRSLIVFTNDQCELRINNSNPYIDVCTLRQMGLVLSERLQSADEILSMEEIDTIFSKLAKYSPMCKDVNINGTVAPFYSWIAPIETSLKNKLAETEENFKIEKKKMKEAKMFGILTNVMIAIACVVISTLLILGFKIGYYNSKTQLETNYNTAIESNNRIVSELEQKFQHVDKIDNQYIDDLATYVEASDVSLKPLTDDAVNFTATLTMQNEVYEIYNIVIEEDAKYIVMLESGNIHEYDLFGEDLSYNQYSNTIGKYNLKSRELALTQFYGISDTSEISYIKLVGVSLKIADLNGPIIKDNLEIELYSK